MAGGGEPGPDLALAARPFGDLPAPRLLPCGDSAVSVEFGSAVDPGVHAHVMALDRAVNAAGLAGLVETVPTYRSLLIQFDPLALGYDDLSEAVLALGREPPAPSEERRRWRVPAVYGGAFGVDLDGLAARHGLTTDEVVRLHAGAVYTVFMIGFLPGFAYLGGLDPRLATPRREEPRARIPSQSISIGGVQAAIGSVEGPSGWRLIGRTPARSFMPGRDPVFLYGAGDEIVFEPIPERDWAALDRDAAAGLPVAVREPS